MSKLGVGVGEDFPVDEQNRPQPEESAAPRFCDPDWAQRRAERREAWRRLRDNFRAEWRAHNRAMHERWGREDPVQDIDRPHIHHLVLGALALIGIAALLGRHHHRS